MEQTKPKRRRRRARRRKIFFLTLLVLIVFLAAGALSLTVLFPAQQIRTEGSQLYTAEEIIEASGIKKGENLLRLSRKKVLANLQKELPYIDNLKLEKRFPNGVTLKVTDAQPEYCFTVSQNRYLTGQSYRILAENPAETQEVISVSAAVTVKDSKIVFENAVDRKVLETLMTYRAQLNLPIHSVDLSDPSSLRIRLANRFEVQLGTDSELGGKMAHLSSMLSAMEEGKGGTINLASWTPGSPQAYFIEGNLD